MQWLASCRWWLVWCLVCIGNGISCLAKPVRLSEAATISLITCAPGTETYALFGHSALRVADPVRGLDQVYNYGTFNFQTSHFYWRFLRGDLRYFLSVVPFRNFQRAYEQEGRAVSEQVLALEPREVQRAYSHLESTLHSPAKYYQYQFFADNCSTRLFEVLNASVDTPLRLDSSQVSPAATYRQLLVSYLRPAPWVKLGMNIGLGWPADRATHFRQRLFLPLELQRALAKATRKGRPFVARQHQVVTASSRTASHAAFAPMGLLLGWMAWSLLMWRWTHCPTWLRRLHVQVLFGATALLGGLLTALSLASLHTPVQANYQLLWLLPSHLVLVARPCSWWRTYIVISLALLIIGSLLTLVTGYVQLLPEVGALLALLAGNLLWLRTWGKGSKQEGTNGWEDSFSVVHNTG
ncbi:protein of unknown function [Hymenobacter mucosus]|uniref:Uncharacterized protein n=1 Tax=Hymenobacter mucosus TaxID=1411120 RepID=A0A239AKR9_9BACT|nr:protein of unknown function [Hymenobacter mucosus]